MPDQKGSSSVVFAFGTEGDKLTGTIANAHGETPISDGKVEGDRISFRTVDDLGGEEVIRLFEASVSGNEARFTCRAPNGADHQEFKAIRLAQPLLATRAPRDFAAVADPDAPVWRGSGVVSFDTDRSGAPVLGHRLEVRSLWTKRFLYFLFACPYEELNLRPNPSRATKTDGLWNWDVVELFISAGTDYLGHYKEFELSPQGEWLDMDITRPRGPIAKNLEWNSGLQVDAKVEAKERIWYAVMKIPIASFDPREGVAGQEYHLSLCRIQGPGPDLQRKRVVWYPADFHYPAQLLRLTD
jgi:hypothetical protein